VNARGMSPAEGSCELGPFTPQLERKDLFYAPNEIDGGNRRCVTVIEGGNSALDNTLLCCSVIGPASRRL
jgi:hypothetical protein